MSRANPSALEACRSPRGHTPQRRQGEQLQVGYVIEELLREVEAGETARAGAPGDHGLLDDPGMPTRCTHDVRHPGPTQWVRDPLCPAAGPLDQCLACAKDTQATLVHPILPL